jgi:signal transduction histidine kinase
MTAAGRRSRSGANLLRRSLTAAPGVPSVLVPPDAAARLAAATIDIFGVPWCRLIAADGRVLATVGPAHRPESDPGTGDEPGPDGSAGPGNGRPVTEAPLGLGTDGRRLEAGLPVSGEWSAADQDGLEVMALLAGTVLAEVEQYSREASRADRLDRRNGLQREFLRSVSHNLRAPLATIELAASDLLDLGAGAYVHARAEAIRIEERRLARLVAQVLILSRMETGTLQLDDEPLALAPIVRRVARELGIAGLVTISGADHGEIAFADLAATEQITWILLDNAARYAPGRPIHVEIGLADSDPEPAIVLAIEDEGPGVAPGEERRIFRRFVRGSAARGVEGTGLGLSVARGLARALGGDVHYRPGHTGARFEVSLPYGGGDADAPDAGGPETEHSPAG